jgi:hypothetical protein
MPDDFDKNLQAYCHYPLILAKQELEHSHKDMYRIVTINWTYATDHDPDSEIVDYEHVHNNIYDKSLGELFEWWLYIEEAAEYIISIEKIDE